MGTTKERAVSANRLSEQFQISASGLTPRDAFKEESKYVNRYWVNHQTCSLWHKTHDVFGPYKMNAYFAELIRNSSRFKNAFIHLVVIAFRSDRPCLRNDLSLTLSQILSSIIHNCYRDFHRSDT